MRYLTLVLVLSGCVDGELVVPKKGASAQCCRVLGDIAADGGCEWREVPYETEPFGEPWVDEGEVCRNAGYRPGES
jgi:hypothetical protein